MPADADLSPEDEVRYMKEVYGDRPEKLYAALIDSFNTLHARAQLLLSLVAICLTITGFSGPRMAGACALIRWCLAVGLALVLSAALVLLFGPLRLQWATQRRAADVETSLVALLRRRNARTRAYRAAGLLLGGGLTVFILGVIVYLTGYVAHDG